MMPVIVVDIPAEAGKALLSFLYCGEAHVPVSIIPQLVSGAKFLGISGFGEPVSRWKIEHPLPITHFRVLSELGIMRFWPSLK
jgi:hypothetical protein